MVDGDDIPIDLLVQNLQDAACDQETIEKFIELQKARQYKEQLLLLAKSRNGLLQSLHVDQRRLDCLDYLLYKIRANI